jgi:hypothetical protein
MAATPLQKISLYKTNPTIITTINIPVPFQPIPPVKSVKFPLLPLFNESCKEPVGLFFISLCLNRSLFSSGVSS